MVKVVKSAEKPRKESATEKKKRKYKSHKERLRKLEEQGLLEEYLNGHKCGHDIAKRAKVNQLANEREVPPHNLEQFKTGIQSYFNKIENMKEEKVTKDGDVVEVKKHYPMTIESLLKHLGISYYWWQKYSEGEGFENYHETASAAKMTIIANILEGGLTNEFNSKLSTFYLQNISKLRERPEQEQMGGVKTVNFITVKDRKELKKVQGEIIDVEVEDDE